MLGQRQVQRPSGFKDTYSNLMRFRSFFHPIGSDQKGVECLAIRRSGAGGDKEKLVLPVVYTLIFPLAVVGPMLMPSFLFAKVVYPECKRRAGHCRQKRHEVRGRPWWVMVKSFSKER